MRAAGTTARPSGVAPKMMSPAATICTDGCPATSTAPIFALASSGLMSMAPPDCTTAMTGPVAAAATAAMSASCPSEKAMTVRSWPSVSRSRLEPIERTTMSAAAAAAAAAATPLVSLDPTEGTPRRNVAPATCCASASAGTAVWFGHGVEP